MNSNAPAPKPKAPEDRAMNVGATLAIFGAAILGLYAAGWGFRGLTGIFGWELQPVLGIALLAVGLVIVALRVRSGVPLSWLLREGLRPENRESSNSAPPAADANDNHPAA